jgi:hypothetical protein
MNTLSTGEKQQLQTPRLWPASTIGCDELTEVVFDFFSIGHSLIVLSCEAVAMSRSFGATLRRQREAQTPPTKSKEANKNKN